jgi:CubicO group peptidase (beta-lactamase class C family)
MQFIRMCGPAGWGLLVISVVVTATTVYTVYALIRFGTARRIRLRHHLNALVFWGFMGATLGFVAQTSAIYNAMTVIIPAESISPERIEAGFRQSFLPSFWGFGILATSLILFFVFRLLVGSGTDGPGGGSPRKHPGLGPAVVALALLVAPGVLSPALAGTGDDPITSGVWLGKAGPDDVVFRFWITGGGSLAGEAHTLRDGKHRTHSPAVDVSWDDPVLEARMNTGVVLKGRLDRGGNRIDGELHHQGRMLMKLPLAGTDPGDVRGLLARPAPGPGEPVYRYTVPEETGDGWRPADPETAGLERAALEALVSDVIGGKAGLLHSLLLARGGRLVLEEYFHGYNRDDLHRLASVTKSVSSLITGVAVDRGDIDGVDTPLARFFPEHADRFRGGWRNVTLGHLLTMSIGAAWTEAEAERTHGAGDEFFGQLLSREFAHEPGTHWQYVSANVNLLGGVIKYATGLHADEYAAEFLFRPLGIDAWNWEYGAVDGYRLMDGSLMLRPRDTARLGELVRDRGRWNGTRVISAEWMEESTAPHIVPSAGGPEKYGYLWWLFYIPSGGGVHEAIVASGRGSQFTAVFPALDLVLVTTGANDENGKHFAIGRLLSVHPLDTIAPSSPDNG